MRSAERKTEKEFYSEAEAARLLGISGERLRRLVEENMFNDGRESPRELTFRAADLVLLGFWHRSTPNPKVLRMPRRR